MTQQVPETIETIRHSMYVSAERWWWIAGACVLMGVSASLISLRSWFDNGSFSQGAALVISMLAPVLAAAARLRSAACAGRADVCRRAFLYRDALGDDLSLDERRIVALWPAHTQLNKVTTSAPYFSSTQTTGPGRLADNVAESAFFTSALARKIAVTLFTLLSVGVLVLLSTASGMSTMAVDPADSSHLPIIVGMIAAATLTLLVGEVLVIAIAYQTLANESHDAFVAATQFVQLADQKWSSAMRIAESYSIALAANLPIPNLLYRWYHDRLDRAYRHALAPRSAQ